MKADLQPTTPGVDRPASYVARILVVDDEKSIRTTLGAILRSEGHQVEIAGDVAQAQALLAQGDWDVVVTDIVMPGLSGIELLKAIRSAAPDVQVILMTGEPTVETAAEAIRSGASDYLSKPVSKQAMLQSVTTALQIKLLTKERESRENCR